MRPPFAIAALLAAGAALSLSVQSAPPAKPQMQEVLDAHASLKPKPITELSAPEARKQPSPADGVKALLKKKGMSTAPEAVGKVENRTIDGPAGNKIPVRIYWPKGDGPFAVVLYIHGGGWVIADLDTYDASPRALANAANAVVVSTHYRQGPEHRFPAAHDDTFAAYQWVLKNGKSLKGNTERVAVVGESAGGNMALAVALQARDKKVQLPAGLVLVYPVASYDFETPSYKENADAKPLNRDMMKWFIKNYMKSPDDAKNPLLTPATNAELKGMPPTTIITAQIDPLRSEGQALAEKMKAAGVKVESKTYDGVTHEFFGMAAVVDEAKDAQQFAAAGLKRAFGN
ncbi:MAG TPA: alpha/beta hydrolase [Usitatibacter sp.]|nr:alpha/beta hydrolase [Usitatibacter sp.]